MRKSNLYSTDFDLSTNIIGFIVVLVKQFYSKRPMALTTPSLCLCVPRCHTRMGEIKLAVWSRSVGLCNISSRIVKINEFKPPNVISALTFRNLCARPVVYGFGSIILIV